MYYKQLSYKLLFFLTFSAVTSCNIPKDPEDSWEDIQKNGLQIGVIVNPPYTIQQNSFFSGTEIELIQNFSSENKLQSRYISGNETDLTDKLENYEIDILLGGFTKKSIWSKKVGLTTPYDNEDHVFLIPKGENKLLHNLESFIFKNKRK
tara:strand:- start:270044 stop:270493 length:450 start_codon:yes stop_codon:yes gene_type:complete